MVGYIWTRESNVYDEEKYSLKSQLDACIERAAEDGVSVPPENIYRVQFSGVDLFEIPELDQLFQRLEADKKTPKRIYCYRQDRMIRGKEGEEIFYITTRFRRARASVVFVKDGKDLDTIGGKIQALVEGIAAAKEIDKIRDNTMRGKRKKVMEGKLWGLGRDKFGYRKNREQGIAEIDEGQADVVRRIFREVGEGKGLLTIAKDLNHDGIPTSFARRGEKRSQWHPATVRVLLRDPAYKGEVWAYRHGGEPLRMPDGLFPAIVDAVLWDRVQQRLDTNRGEKARNQKRPALLRGLIFCGVCGSRLYLAIQHGIYYYRCSSEFNKRHEVSFTVCQGKSARADRIEKEVWDKFVWYVNNPAAFVEALQINRTAGAIEGLERRRDVVFSQIRQKETEQERLVKTLRQEEGRVASLITDEIRKLEVERRGLQAEADAIKAQLHQQQGRRIDADQIYARCHELSVETSGALTFDQRRARLEEFRITILANGLIWDFASSASK